MKKLHIAAAVTALCVVTTQGQLLSLTNTKAGISISLSGANGTDWAVERTYHDASIADQIVYLKDDVDISLAHNERNSITINTPSIPHVLGINGPDGIPDSGDEGDIYYKIDRDLQAHLYSTKTTALPAYCVPYSAPFRFDTLTYDGSLAVLGAIGDNGGPWGSRPRYTTERFAYGQHDAFSNEWHTLTYWDDDEPLLAAAGVDSHRQGASDGHCVFVCVNPLTPVMQLTAPAGEEFYTTPVKTYHVPKIWAQTSYLTAGVEVHLVNLTNGDPVQYRVEGGAWQNYGGSPLTASNLFSQTDTTLTLEARCGVSGAVLARTVVMEPAYPASGEQHGYMLWADESAWLAAGSRLHTMQPFKTSYETFQSTFYQGASISLDDTRGEWNSGSTMAIHALNNALVMSMEGPDVATSEAARGKTRLLRMARLQPIGFEQTVSYATPAKDFITELGQVVQNFGDAGVAYDLVAAHYRESQHPGGISPIEELLIRDGLAKLAKSILQVRGNWSAESGSGDTHWGHGFELAFGAIAFAMPTYSSPYYGTSGADLTTTNQWLDSEGHYWNPFPDQGATWYGAATDPSIATPGHPNIRASSRSEFQINDEGYWTGPNDLKGDGDRYFTGVQGTRLVDVKYNGMANADCRVELVEMDGYESPFVTRIHALDFLRRIRNARSSPLCVEQYILRRLTGGYVLLNWDGGSKTYAAEERRIQDSLCAFNNEYEYASQPGVTNSVGTFLNNLNIYYGFTPGTLDPETYDQIDQSDRKILYRAHELAMCMDPSQLDPYAAGPNHAPIVKPMFKHVVNVGEQVRKDILATDPDGDAPTVTVTNLPAGAVYDQPNRRITWTPGSGDTGVYVVTVTADDGQEATAREFPIIVKTDAPSGPIPSAPLNLNAAFIQSPSSISLAWDAPVGVNVSRYIVYRDGAFWGTTEGHVTTFTDSELLASFQHMIYHVSLLDAKGTESGAISVPLSIPQIYGNVIEVKTQPPSNVSATSATLNGEVVAVSGPTDAVYICWGDEDGGTASTSDWDQVDFIGIGWTPGQGFSDNVATDADTIYYYRAYLQSPTDEDWADNVQVFTYSQDLPFIETFEINPPTMAGVLGPVHGQHGWTDADFSAVVQDSEAWEFDQAAELADAELSHTFDDAKTNVWSVFAWKPSAGTLDALNVPSDATVVFWANTNGTLSAYSNQAPVDTGAAVNTSTWTRVQVHSDYGQGKWSLWMNGSKIVNDFDFYTHTLSAYAGIRFRAYEASTLYVDDVRIGTAAWNPLPGDTDGDGLDDDWELLYFRSPNIVSDGTGHADADGMTDGDEEVAGTDPTDEASFFAVTDKTMQGGSELVIRWPSVTGRKYAVEGCSNLVLGLWSNIESNIPSTPAVNVYTVQVDSVEQLFNRVRVRKE